MPKSAQQEPGGYNPVAEALLVPFDQSLISQREMNGNTFDFVSPEHYRYRLLEVFGEGFTFSLDDVRVIVSDGIAGLQGTAHFVGERDNVKYDITTTVFEAFVISKTTTHPISVEQSYMKLMSAGIKAVSREMGLGLHLYDKAPATAKAAAPKTSTAAPKATTAAAPKATAKPATAAPKEEAWDGSLLIAYGTKHKGTPYNEVDDGWLQWAGTQKDPPDRNAVKEIARRQKAAGSEEPGEPGESAEDVEFPF